MAQIDFSNAVIDVISSRKPLRLAWLGLSDYNSATSMWSFQANISGYGTVNLVGSYTMSVLENTATKYSLSFVGSIANLDYVSNLNYFDIAVRVNSSTIYPLWRVSNISYSRQDTFSFVIDVDVIGG